VVVFSAEEGRAFLQTRKSAHNGLSLEPSHRMGNWFWDLLGRSPNWLACIASAIEVGSSALSRQSGGTRGAPKAESLELGAVGSGQPAVGSGRCGPTTPALRSVRRAAFWPPW
jgi:hypothetical protein